MGSSMIKLSRWLDWLVPGFTKIDRYSAFKLSGNWAIKTNKKQAVARTVSSLCDEEDNDNLWHFLKTP